MTEYVELHACSAFSFLEGASAPEGLIAQCAEFDMPAMALLDRDLNGDEVRLSLEESGALAHVLGIRGTPSYVIGETVVVGAVGTAALSDKIKAVRK